MRVTTFLQIQKLKKKKKTSRFQLLYEGVGSSVSLISCIRAAVNPVLPLAAGTYTAVILPYEMLSLHSTASLLLQWTSPREQGVGLKQAFYEKLNEFQQLYKQAPR